MVPMAAAMLNTDSVVRSYNPCSTPYRAGHPAPSSYFSFIRVSRVMKQTVPWHSRPDFHLSSGQSVPSPASVEHKCGGCCVRLARGTCLQVLKDVSLPSATTRIRVAADK
jgi:hypothetical protein